VVIVNEVDGPLSAAALRYLYLERAVWVMRANHAQRSHEDGRRDAGDELAALLRWDPPAEERPPDNARHTQGVHQHGRNTTGGAVRLVKHAELSQHRGAIVVDRLAAQPIRLVKGEDAAQRERDLPAGGGKPAPRA